MLGCIGCIEVTPIEQATPPVFPTSFPTQTPIPADSGWQQVDAGLEQRRLLIYEDVEIREDIFVLRVDTEIYAFEVLASPRQPKSLPQWQEESGADILINGGYFTDLYEPTGLTIINGEPYGQSYSLGGMVAVKDGVPSVWGLAGRPYDVSAAWDSGLQAFPMLVEYGMIAISEEAVSKDKDRRTVIATDTNGNILLLIAQRTYFDLFSLSTYLAESDLQIVNALNLDGGSSTSLLMREPAVSIASISVYPTVISVTKR